MLTQGIGLFGDCKVGITTFFNYLGSKILTEEYLPTNVIKNNTLRK